MLHVINSMIFLSLYHRMNVVCLDKLISINRIMNRFIKDTVLGFYRRRMERMLLIIFIHQMLFPHDLIGLVQ